MLILSAVCILVFAGCSIGLKIISNSLLQREENKLSTRHRALQASQDLHSRSLLQTTANTVRRQFETTADTVRSHLEATANTLRNHLETTANAVRSHRETTANTIKNQLETTANGETSKLETTANTARLQN